MNRLLRLLNVLSKKKLGILVGLCVGIAACLITPMFMSIFYAKTMFWIAQEVSGQFAKLSSLLMFAFFMLTAAFLMSGLRVFIAHFFRGRKYRTR